MFYYLYEIRNLINNKIYVGVHKTRGMNDGYMGSGKVIRSAIEKYGIENFTKVILETFDDEKEMYARERAIVTEEFLSRDDVYNLRRGGTGGFDWINKNNLHGFSDPNIARKARETTNQILRERYGENWRTVVGKLGAEKAAPAIGEKIKSDPLFLLQLRENAKKACIKAASKEANDKRKKTFAKIGHQQGEKNSNYGNCWVTNGVQNLLIKKTDPIPTGFKKGRVMGS